VGHLLRNTDKEIMPNTDITRNRIVKVRTKVVSERKASHTPLIVSF
jgi:hypothetical protein